MITRRQSLAMTVGAVTAGMIARAGSSPAPAAPGSLHELAKLKGMRFGSTVSDGPKGSFNDPNYAHLVYAEFSASRMLTQQRNSSRADDGPPLTPCSGSPNSRDIPVARISGRT
jgi:hypothetical protein